MTLHVPEAETLDRMKRLLDAGRLHTVCKGEVIEVMEDLRSVYCAILTIGQYLSPSPVHYPVVEYVHPDTFKKVEKIGYDMGFLEVNAGPLVRSSYHAAGTFSGIDANKMRRGIQKNHG